MNILLVNAPNAGRSIPEEEYGLTSIKRIFRGEPLGLETLAGNLLEHQVEILDPKVEPLPPAPRREEGMCLRPTATVLVLHLPAG